MLEIHKRGNSARFGNIPDWRKTQRWCRSPHSFNLLKNPSVSVAYPTRNEPALDRVRQFTPPRFAHQGPSLTSAAQPLVFVPKIEPSDFGMEFALWLINASRRLTSLEAPARKKVDLTKDDRNREKEDPKMRKNMFALTSLLCALALLVTVGDVRAQFTGGGTGEFIDEGGGGGESLFVTSITITKGPGASVTGECGLTLFEATGGEACAPTKVICSDPTPDNFVCSTGIRPCSPGLSAAAKAADFRAELTANCPAGITIGGAANIIVVASDKPQVECCIFSNEILGGPIVFAGADGHNLGDFPAGAAGCTVQNVCDDVNMNEHLAAVGGFHFVKGEINELVPALSASGIVLFLALAAGAMVMIRRRRSRTLGA